MSQFRKLGFVVYYVAAEPLAAFIADDLAEPFDADDARDDYFRTDLDEHYVAQLNAQNIYYRMPDSVARDNLSSALNVIADDVAYQLGHSWRVVNVRTWSARPGISFGPSAWHSDGFPSVVNKMMIYLNPPNEDNGTIGIEARDGKKHIIESTHAALVLLDVGLCHCGIPGVSRVRPAIEVTVVRSEITSTELVFAGANARYPKSVG